MKSAQIINLLIGIKPLKSIAKYGFLNVSRSMFKFYSFGICFVYSFISLT